MYRELISELSKNINWVSLQPPCPEPELEQAQQVVGCTFPEELKDCLRETNGDKWCLLSAAEIIENIQRNRTHFLPLFEEMFSREAYLDRVDRFLFFATNGCGDYYGYRVESDGTVKSTTVYLWEHENLTEECCWRKVAANLADMLTRYYHDEI